MEKKVVTSKVDDDLVALVQEFKPYFDLAKKTQKSLHLQVKEDRSYLYLLWVGTNNERIIEALRKGKNAATGRDQNSNQGGTLKKKKVSLEREPRSNNERAKHEGIIWAGNTTYVGLKFVVDFWQHEINEALQKQTLLDGPDIGLSQGEILRNYFERLIFPFYSNMEWKTLELNEFIPDWLSGVNDFWDIIKNKI